MPDQLPEKTIAVDGVPATRPLMDIADKFSVMTSLPSELPEHRMAILEMIDAEHEQLAEYINTPFPLANFILHPATKMNRETGEMEPFMRVILLTDQGPTLVCGATGVLNSLPKLGWAVGRMPPWEPGIWVVAKRIKTSGPGYTIKLVPAKAP